MQDWRQVKRGGLDYHECGDVTTRRSYGLWLWRVCNDDHETPPRHRGVAAGDKSAVPETVPPMAFTVPTDCGNVRELMGTYRGPKGTLNVHMGFAVLQQFPHSSSQSYCCSHTSQNGRKIHFVFGVAFRSVISDVGLVYR